MSELAKIEFKKWLLASGKMPSTINSYVGGVNKISKHLNKDVFEIRNIDELARIFQQYGRQGEHAQIGARNSGNVQNGLKQWLVYQKQLTLPGGVEAAKAMVDRSYTPALNQIFYGPPGTGKTYATIDAALEILDPECLIADGENREALKKRFDELSTAGQIRFVTFHQSFSYEDFVEGLRAVSDDEDKQLQYKVEPGVFKRLCDDARTQGVHSETGIRSNPRKPYVLIIDEINRGNVSRIFGELITLIEPSKREGAAEALSVELPYSKRPFNVPGNVYLIGTMNTADRSLSGLDIALRRRFNFREMPPQPELLDDLTVAGVNIGQLLRVMNQRIEVLLDRDHCLGHAYFMSLQANDPLDKLELIFRNQILPLLQEYFFEDWQRIQWVLNDHRKSAADRFVSQRQRDVQSLFGANVNVSAHNLPWTINESAFERPSAYAGIIEVQATVEDIMETLIGEEA